MPLTGGNNGTDADGSKNEDYCMYCYNDGAFTQDFTMSQMVEFCVRFTDQMNEQGGWDLTPEQARDRMLRLFPHLKRWKRKDRRSLVEKAEALLAQCDQVVLASVDVDGFPRPVPMRKGRTIGCNRIWMAEGRDFVQAAGFGTNPKAGLCYSHYGDSVALRGTVDIVTDKDVRREMWQDRYIHQFPGGADDSAYVLLRFVGTHAGIWIDGRYAHEEFL